MDGRRPLTERPISVQSPVETCETPLAAAKFGARFRSPYLIITALFMCLAAVDVAILTLIENGGISDVTFDSVRISLIAVMAVVSFWTISRLRIRRLRFLIVGGILLVLTSKLLNVTGAVPTWNDIPVFGGRDFWDVVFRRALDRSGLGLVQAGFLLCLIELNSLALKLDAEGTSLRKEAQFSARELASVRERLAALFHNSPDACFLCNADSTVIDCNPAAARIAERPQEHVVGMCLMRIFEEPGGHARLKSITERVVAAATVDPWECRLTQRTGPLVLEVSVFPVELSTDELVLVIARDVTLRRHAEELLLTASAELERRVAERTAELCASNASLANEITERKALEERLIQNEKLTAVGQLAGGVAHNFNNLLTVVIGNISLVKESCPSAALAMLDGALDACDRAAALIRQLLAFGRQIPTSIVPTRIEPVLEDIVQIMTRTFDRRIEIAYHPQDSIPPVLADAGQIHQALLNFCINARDAVQALPLSVHDRVLRITLDAEVFAADATRHSAQTGAQASEYVRIRIADTGVGIAEETKKCLFEPFFSTKEVGKGTGLGLATAFGIASQHGGWIDVDSTLGHGATFSIYLPQAKTIPPAVQVTHAPPSQSHFVANECRGNIILVVDDEPCVRGVTLELLGREGYPTLEAVDGVEALVTFAANYQEISLVILDLSMPRLSGEETLARLRQIRQDIKIIVCTGYSLNGSNSELPQGATAFLFKPFRSRELLDTVRNVLEGIEPGTPDGIPSSSL